MRSLEARRVAVVGGIRIPFCRAHTAYARCSNQDMMTAVLQALVTEALFIGTGCGGRCGDVSEPVWVIRRRAQRITGRSTNQYDTSTSVTMITAHPMVATAPGRSGPS